MYTRAQYLKELAAAQAEYNRTKDQAKFDAVLSDIVSKINNELATNTKGADVSPNDVAQLLNMSPSLLAKKQAEAQAAQQAGIANSSLDVLNQGIQMAMSLGQISKAKQAASQLERPSIPSVAPSNPQLAQALNQAQLGTINVNDVLNPAKAQIQDAYNSAINQAKVASGGQAGSYQGLANLANIQRMRASLGLVPIAQEAKLQNQQVYNQLLGQRQEEIANQQRMRLAGTQMALDQYDKDAQAIGVLGSLGRTNALNAGNQLTQTLQGLAPLLKSTLPNSPFGDQGANDFYNQARTENYLRNNGYGSADLDQVLPLMTKGQLPYGY